MSVRSPPPTLLDMAEDVLLAGRYALGAVLGRGGSATVRRAQDRATGRAVVVKVYDGADLLAGRGAEREAVVLTGLRHPGLVGLRAVGRADGCAYVVMDLVDGPTLAHELGRGPLPAPAVALLGARLADALAHVHGRGVVHRDVKPANVLLDRDGRPHLADFGLARIVDGARVTRTGEIVGTPAYLAPEQVTGTRVGPAADVYALGLVLLEAVTGRREYEGDVIPCAMARLLRDPSVPPTVPAPLADVLRAMTAAEAHRRPAAAAVARTLGAAPADGAGGHMTDVAVPPRSDAGRMTDKSDLVVRPANDVGGLAPGGPLVPTEGPLTPFEKDCHALLNVLDVHKLVNTEEKRRGVEDLGGQMIGRLSYYERWAVSAARVLAEKGLVTTEELGKRMADVERRWATGSTS